MEVGTQTGVLTVMSVRVKFTVHGGMPDTGHAM